MNRILKLKNNLLAFTLNTAEVPVNRLLHDTRFLLYCFRHYKYVDNNFNLKISNLILTNLQKYQKSIDKSKAINLVVQIHLLNGLKISPSQSQVILDNLKDLSEIPNLRWLLHTATIFMNSGIKSPSLWEIIENHYINNKFTGENQVNSEEILKLAFLMSSNEIHKPILWERILKDLNSQEDTFNFSQKVMLAKSLSRVESEASSLSPSFVNEELHPYLRNLVEFVIENKEHLTLNELVGLFLAANKIGMLKEDFLAKMEGAIFQKVELLPKRQIYDLMKIYDKLPLNNERKTFLKNLRRVLVSKFDENIRNSDANNFNIINNYLYKNKIISPQEFNDPYVQFILEDKFKVFEFLFASRMKTSSIMDIINFSLFIQGQLSKHMLQFSPEALLKVLSFFELRGEISPSFLELVLSHCKKYLNPVQDKHARQQIYAFLIYLKYDDSHSRGPRATKMAENLVEKVEQLNDKEVQEEILRFTSKNDRELGKELIQVIKNHFKSKIPRLNENSVAELFSLLEEEDVKEPKIKESVEDYLGHNFKYMNSLALCKSIHMIRLCLPKEYLRLAVESISRRPSSLDEMEILLRSSEYLPVEVKMHIVDSFKIHKENINWQNVGQIAIILLRILENPRMFDKEFIQSLLGVVSTKQNYFNQKLLDQILGAYSNATKEENKSQTGARYASI